MKLAKLQFKDDTLTTTYPSRVLTGEGYDMHADMTARVVRIDDWLVPFEMVSRMMPDEPANENEPQAEKAERTGLFVCPDCDGKFVSERARAGHKRHCKGREH